jgi:hypothetical protein
VSELHKKLLSILVKDKANESDEEEQEDSQEDSDADVPPDEAQPAEPPFKYFNQTLPINSVTWPEVLLQVLSTDFYCTFSWLTVCACGSSMWKGTIWRMCSSWTGGS